LARFIEYNGILRIAPTLACAGRDVRLGGSATRARQARGRWRATQIAVEKVPDGTRSRMESSPEERAEGVAGRNGRRDYL